jgi:hypothetical protein
MKTIVFTLFIMGLINLYGTFPNPIVPPKSISAESSSIASNTPISTKDFISLLGLVYVTVEVTFTDCPDYTCEAKEKCTFYICIYDQSYSIIDCKLFDPDVCVYQFERIQAEEGTRLYAHLVDVSNCSYTYNSAYEPSSTLVPQGGGTMEIDTHFCE